MTEAPTSSPRQRLRTPRAAAVAGILFAVLYSASLWLIRTSIPPEQAGGDWLASEGATITLALNLVPFAGIAFLWFIGVIRDRLGDSEDRFLATVFLGSGLLFLALTFVAAAVVGGLLTSSVTDPGLLTQGGVYAFSRAVVYQVLNVYAVRMAGVFMMSLGTIWLRTGVMPRGWALLTYGLALILLLSIGYSTTVTFIFPAWVLAVSTYYLIRQSQLATPPTIPG